MLLIVLNLPFSCPVCYHWLAETNSSQMWVFYSERVKAAVWKENLNQLTKCCRTPLVFRLWHEEVSKAWHVCHASWRHVLVRLVAILTSHANLAMTQGTGYVLSDAIFCSVFPPLTLVPSLASRILQHLKWQCQKWHRTASRRMLPPQEKMTEASSGCLNIYKSTVMSHSFPDHSCRTNDFS